MSRRLIMHGKRDPYNGNGPGQAGEIPSRKPLVSCGSSHWSLAAQAIGLLRLKTDRRESTIREAEGFYTFLSKIGALIIDDYGHLCGQHKAGELFASINEHLLLNRVGYSGRVAVKSWRQQRQPSGDR
jgi:hypothetical protein